MNIRLSRINEIQEIGELDVRNTLTEQIFCRQSVSPKRQGFPAPSPEEINLMVRASLTAPDHGDLRPLHFIEIPVERRHELAEIFLSQKKKHCGPLDEHAVKKEHDKAMSAPTLLIAYAKIIPNHPRAPANEQLVSAGAAIQNFMLCAHGLGYGSILLSGERARNPKLDEALGLEDNDQLVGFISVGTIVNKPCYKHRSPLKTRHSVWRKTRSLNN